MKNFKIQKLILIKNYKIYKSFNKKLINFQITKFYYKIKLINKLNNKQKQKKLIKNKNLISKILMKISSIIKIA